MKIKVAIFILLASSNAARSEEISITVQSGKVIANGKEREIREGTFIPSPYDKELAKKIIDCNAEQDKLRVKLDNCEQKFLVFDKYWYEHQQKLTDFYEEENIRLKKEVIESRNWWNNWGKPLLCAIVSAAAATLITLVSAR
jgi:hypothetical protein